MSEDGARVEAWLPPRGQVPTLQSHPLPPSDQTEDRPRHFWKDGWQSVKIVLLGSRLNLLLIAVPLAIVFDILNYSGTTFIFSLIALVPLAERLGLVTEELATYTNDTLGGLLNATFGNATELIICGVSLYSAGKEHDPSFLRIVQLSLLGSILGNLLLVMGTAFLVGGLVHPTQSFNQQGMGVNSGMLIMAVSSILLPSTLSETDREAEGKSELALSRFMSIIMLILYALYLIFQLVTHKHLYEQAEDHDPAEGCSVPTYEHMQSYGSKESPIRRSSLDDRDGYIHNPAALHRARTMIVHGDIEEDDEEENMGLGWAIIWLALITVLIAYLSEMVVDTIKEAHTAMGIPLPFLSTIVLPLVGNAAEHASAILFAYKNKMEITLGVAVGSATQIAVLVIPFTIILGWMMQQPLDLNFQWFEAFTLFLSTMIAIISVNDGTSNWIKGLLLMTTYTFVSGAFWVHTDKNLTGGV